MHSEAVVMSKHGNEFAQVIFYEIMDYIDSVLPGNITLEDLQNKSGYSKRHISRLFNTYTGVSPSVYIKTMQAYRMFLELWFTNITPEDVCKKYDRSDVRHFKKMMPPVIKSNCTENGVAGHINFKKIKTNKKLIFPKRYVSCSFVSLFDYNIQAIGVKHTILRSGDAIMTSHHSQIDGVVNDFCKTYNIERDNVWTCAKFTPFDSGLYDVGLYTCVTGDPKVLPEGEPLSLQGDYICFSWVGHPEDTFQKIKSFYDVFFFSLWQPGMRGLI